jgi:hypothetical protein
MATSGRKTKRKTGELNSNWRGGSCPGRNYGLKGETQSGNGLQPRDIRSNQGIKKAGNEIPAFFT